MIYKLYLNSDFNASLQEITEKLKTSSLSLHVELDNASDQLICTSNLINSSLEEIANLYKIHGKPTRNKLTLNNIEYLSEFAIIKLLNNPALVDMLRPSCFIKLLEKSAKIASFILSRPYLQKKLDSINSEFNTQTLTYSCTARSILMALRSMQMISEAEFTRSKELEIYLAVCETYGKPADAAKIVSYLKKLNIDIAGIEIKESIADTLYSPISAKNITFNLNPLFGAYTLFKKNTPNIRYLSKKDDSLFPENKPALMVVENGDEGGSHIVFCLKQSNQYIVINPANEVEKEFNDLESMMMEIGGLGVFFVLSPKVTPKEDLATGMKKT